MNKEKCSRCGYNKYLGCLHIHHIDGNHENNSPDNLEVLCANCHFEIHVRTTRQRLANSKCHKLKEELLELIIMHNRVITEYREENEELRRQLTAHVPMR